MWHQYGNLVHAAHLFSKRVNRYMVILWILMSHKFVKLNKKKTFRNSTVIATVSLLWRDHDQSNLWKIAFDWRLVYSFRVFLHVHHGRKHGSRQAGIELDQELSAYSLCIMKKKEEVEEEEKEKKKRINRPDIGFWNLKIHLQWHTIPHKAIPTGKQTLWACGNHSHSNYHFTPWTL